MIAIFGVVALLLIGSVASTPLKICAFDVQLFGTWKARLGPAMEAIQLVRLEAVLVFRLLQIIDFSDNWPM